jgi:hypothetical protein
LGSPAAIAEKIVGFGFFAAVCLATVVESATGAAEPRPVLFAAVPESLQPQLDRQRHQSAAKRAPEVNGVIARAIEGLRAEGLAGHALGVGDPAPPFELPSALGKPIASGALLGRGPIVLAFYRGVW